MKSLAVSVFWPAWTWTWKPELRWLFASYAQSLSVRDSVKCRRVIESPWYQELWGLRLTDDQNTKLRYENDRTGYRLATSVDGAATGEGGDVIVADDPHNVREAHSKAIRESTVEWWRASMSTRLNNPRTGCRVIVMQRVHESDLSGYVLEEGGWEHLCLPARYEPQRHCVTSIGWEDPRRKEGELLWPEHFGEEQTAELEKRLGSYDSAGQLQQRPAPAAGGILKREWFRFYGGPGQPRRPVRFEEQLLSWDCAFKGEVDSDFVVGQCWGRVGADRYLLDQVRGQKDFPATISAVQTMADAWPGARAKLVEDKANGPAVIATLKRRVPGLIAVTPEGSKESRAHAVAPLAEAGNVWLPDPSIAPWVEEFLAEVTTFPRAPHDDQVDAMTQALLRMARPAPVGRIPMARIGTDYRQALAR